MSDEFLNFIAASLFVFLLCGATNKVYRRFIADGRVIPLPRRSVPIYVVFSTLFVYALCRAVVLLLIGLDKISNTENLEETQWQTIPAAAFCALQTTMIWKWVRHAADVSALLMLPRNQWGTIVVLASSGTLLCLVALSVLVAVEVHENSPLIRLSRADWKTLIDLYTGGMYMFNGSCFLALGVSLHRLWSSPAESDKPMRFRMLLMAGFFGLMCVVRGMVLVLFLYSRKTDDSVTSGASTANGAPRKHLDTVLQSSWGAPVILIAEWLCIVVALFYLPISSEQGSTQNGEQQSAPRETTTPRSIGLVVNRSINEYATGGSNTSSSLIMKQP